MLLSTIGNCENSLEKWIIKDETILLHISCISQEKRESHIFEKKFNFCNIFSCKICNLNVYFDNSINVEDKFCIEICSPGELHSYMNDEKYNFSCNEYIIKNIIE